MGTTAGLGIDAFDVDDSEFVARDHTTLVKVETKLSLSLGLIHEALADGAA